MRNEAQASEKRINGDVTTPEANANAPAKTAAVEETADSPGLGQLVICVLGIYAALYGSSFRKQDGLMLTYQKPLLGCLAGSDYHYVLSHPCPNRR